MSIGIVRRIDREGRIVIPKEVREVLRLKEGDSMEIIVDGNTILLLKHEREDYSETVKQLIQDILSVRRGYQ